MSTKVNPFSCPYGLAQTLILGSLAIFAESAAAHPFHISTAEMEWDAKTNRIQVSLKLQAADFESALSQLAGKRINIDKGSLDELITTYLDRHFFLAGQPDAKTQPAENRPSGHTRSQAHFLGLQLKGTWLMLYFELELPANRDVPTDNATTDTGWTLSNTVLFETTEGQINTIAVRHSNQRTALKMTRQEPSAEFKSEWLNPK